MGGEIEISPGSAPAAPEIPVPPATPEQPEISALEEGVFWGWSRGDRNFVWVLGSLILLSLMLRVFQLSRQSGGLIEIHRLPERQLEFQIDVNEAGWVEWMQLEGIGESLARRIVADRDAHGRFRSVEDVERVPGIGPAILRQIRPYLTCAPPARETEQ